VIAHATITIALNGVSGRSRVVQSNDAGNYTATNLPAGTYTISCFGSELRDILGS